MIWSYTLHACYGHYCSLKTSQAIESQKKCIYIIYTREILMFSNDGYDWKLSLYACFGPLFNFFHIASFSARFLSCGLKIFGVYILQYSLKPLMKLSESEQKRRIRHVVVQLLVRGRIKISKISPRFVGTISTISKEGFVFVARSTH